MISEKESSYWTPREFYFYLFVTFKFGKAFDGYSFLFLFLYNMVFTVFALPISEPELTEHE